MLVYCDIYNLTLQMVLLQVTYNVSDAAGNAATEVTRTVNVVADPCPGSNGLIPLMYRWYCTRCCMLVSC